MLTQHRIEPFSRVLDIHHSVPSSPLIFRRCSVLLRASKKQAKTRTGKSRDDRPAEPRVVFDVGEELETPTLPIAPSASTRNTPDRTPQEIYPVFPRLRDAANEPIGSTPWTWADAPEEENDADSPLVIIPAWNPRTGFMQQTRDASGSMNASSSSVGAESPASSSSGGMATGGPAVASLRVRQRRSNSVQPVPGSLSTTEAVSASRAAAAATAGSQVGELPAVGKGQILSACFSTSFWMCVAAVVIRGSADLSAAAVLGTDPEKIQQLLQLPSGLESYQNAAIMVTVVAGVTAARFTLLTTWPEFQAATQRSNQQVLEPLNYLDIAIVAGLTGVSEELLFRSAIIPATSPDWIGVLIAGVVFGVLHNSGGRNIAFAGWATVVGVLYGAAFVYTHNIWVVAGAHALANFSSAVAWKNGYPALSGEAAAAMITMGSSVTPQSQISQDSKQM